MEPGFPENPVFFMANQHQNSDIPEIRNIVLIPWIIFSRNYDLLKTGEEVSDRKAGFMPFKSCQIADLNMR